MKLKRVSPLLYPVLSVLIALIIGFAIIIPALDPPAKDIQQLLLFMSATGSMTVLGSYFVYRGGLLQWFNSLRWTLLATTVLTVVLVFLNVWVTLQLMFISLHDLIITTALLVFGGLVSIFSVVFVSGVIIDRIHDLVRAAQKLASGDLETRISVKGNDELANLAQTFNQMANSLQEVDAQKQMLEQARRDLIAWVSHDLRTPLATLRAMNEAIIDGVVTDPETVSRYMHNSQREIENLSRLIDDLFELSQLDSGHLKIEKAPTSLRDLISDTLGSMSARAQNENVSLAGRVDGDLDMVNIAPDKIQRVLYNLLDNAVTHTPPSGRVILRASALKDAVKISVYNSGSYIQPEDIEQVFNSFYKGEPSRALARNGSRGAGLGLAIARGFVEAHGGTIRVASDPQKGTTFTFTIPA